MKAAILLGSLAVGAVAAKVGERDGIEFFETRVRPVLVEHCYECHSAEAKKLKGGLRLDNREELLRGGESGAAIVAGKPDESLLITAVRYHDKDLRMPPPKDDIPRKLADAQIADLVAWVKAGAPLPEKIEQQTSNLEHRSKSHWAFQPRTTPAPPAVKNEAWIKTDLDRFILAKLEAAGLQPAPPADPRILIRRMTFDLLGLPPTPEEADAFSQSAEAVPGTEGAAHGTRGSRQPGAPSGGRKLGEPIRNVLDRLLASPHYGERWGRHWLDVARYADTKGYVYGREERFFVHAYAYRDWVVRAFNEDLPYDRFLLLQIAADQLVPPASSDLAAMGFLTGGRRFIGVTRDIIDDRIDVVTRGTMALTAACARCHDHKYDPIPTRDYYSLYGVFNSCAEQLVNLGQEPTDKDFVAKARKLADTMQQRREEAAARLRKRVREYLAAQLELQKYPDEGFDQILIADDVIPASVRRWRDFLERTKESADPIFAPWHALTRADHSAAGSTVTLNPLVAAAFADPPKTPKEGAERYGRLFAEIDRSWQDAVAEAQRMDLPSPTALPDANAEALREFLYDPRSPTTVPDEAIVNNEQFFPTSVCEELWKLQGDVERWLINTPVAPPHALLLVDREPERNPRVFIRGNPARQGEEVPRQFPAIVAGRERRPFQHGSGRLELAQAIVRPDNPLTARVMVNRIWQHHFGTGLVRTPSDFGTRAEAPSHPELLDWLAGEFIKSGWSVKAMHRLVMSSAVYQQSSAPARTSSADPENRLLAYFPRQRLDFEEVRDTMLAASGELDERLGGKPAELFAAANKRRTIYGLVDRQFLPGTFRVFDFANPDLHIPQRHNTTVPQQALFLLNNAFIAARADAIARRTAEAAPEERVIQFYRALYQRPPTEQEMAAARRFIASAKADTTPSPSAPIATAWQYGWGEYDEAAHRVKTFQPLPHFTGKAWQGAAQWPNENLGWAQLTAEGGHPGNDLQHAIIRRWNAPRDGVVSIAGEIVHEPDAGDGVRAFIVASRHGELKAITLRHDRVEMSSSRVEVRQGDTLDFVVDIGGTLNSDQFLWAPIISTVEAGPATIWNAKQEFTGPAATKQQLEPWQQYAQVLLLANEFSFVD
ncbi:MAG TPA: PSD1 and planctomycete cytochrome C domain-containing protein [Chthoniobacteraceae bacterium]|nr:PSD1 and planctomycete cytochrome C domain-containing protein [Chthoniobacteraceae bacterium]